MVSMKKCKHYNSLESLELRHIAESAEFVPALVGQPRVIGVSERVLETNATCQEEQELVRIHLVLRTEKEAKTCNLISAETFCQFNVVCSNTAKKQKKHVCFDVACKAYMSKCHYCMIKYVRNI